MSDNRVNTRQTSWQSLQKKHQLLLAARGCHYKLQSKIPQHSLRLLLTERSVLRLLRHFLSNCQEQFGALVKAVANKADVKIGGDGPKDDEAKLKEDRERVIDQLKVSTSDIYLLLSAATSSRADKARGIVKKYAPGQQTNKIVFTALAISSMILKAIKGASVYQIRRTTSLSGKIRKHVTCFISFVSIDSRE